MDRFSEDRFHNDDAARAFLEGVLWPDGPTCPHCGVVDHAYPKARRGVYRCAEPACRKDFTVTTGTIMERSHIALHKWLQAFHLMCSSKKGVSAHQIHRTLDIGYKAAWFMCHRIREAMRDGGTLGPLGGEGKIVEADETYFGKTEQPCPSKQRKGRPYKVGSRGSRDKRPIVALVERGGRVRTFHVAVASKDNVTKIVCAPAKRACTPTKATLAVKNAAGKRLHVSTRSLSRTSDWLRSASCAGARNIGGRKRRSEGAIGNRENQPRLGFLGGVAMYEDEELWPFTCAGCGEYFQKQIGWLKTHDAVRCPTCRIRHDYRREELSLKFAEARKGLYDPLRYINRAKHISEFPEGLE